MMAGSLFVILSMLWFTDNKILLVQQTNTSNKDMNGIGIQKKEILCCLHYL